MLQANISLKTAENGEKLNNYINRYNNNLPYKTLFTATSLHLNVTLTLSTFKPASASTFLMNHQ